MLSPLEMVVELRDMLDAGFLAFDAAHRPRVSVGDSGFSDESLQLALNRAKRAMFRTLAVKNADYLMRQASFTYPTGTESVRIEPPNAIEVTVNTLPWRRPLRVSLVEDMTRTGYPLVMPRINFGARIAQSPGLLGAVISGGPMSPYAYSERGGNFYLLPPNSSAVSVRVSYVPEPLAIDIRSDVKEDELPEAVLDWFLAEAAIEASSKYGNVPPALLQKRDLLKREAMSLTASKHVGPRFGTFTRTDDVD